MAAKPYAAAKKAKVFDHYGRVCRRCGETDGRCLTIDHTDQLGAKHRAPNGDRYTGRALYAWLIRNGYPAGFRTLCGNCQMRAYAERERVDG